jgi:hypothetical protein
LIDTLCNGIDKSIPMTAEIPIFIEWVSCPPHTQAGETPTHKSILAGIEMLLGQLRMQ